MKLILFASTRPNFMKIVPLIRAIEKHNASPKQSQMNFDYVLVHTGQHYDVEMSDAFFRDLELPNPDINLEVGSASHAVQTAEILTRFERVCLKKKPDWVVLVGGLQEETTFLNVPCLTLRPNTERPITITQGTNRLISPDTLEQDLEHLGLVLTSATLLRDLTQYPNKCYEFTWLNFHELVL